MVVAMAANLKKERTINGRQCKKNPTKVIVQSCVCACTCVCCKNCNLHMQQEYLCFVVISAGVMCTLCHPNSHFQSVEIPFLVGSLLVKRTEQ